MAVVPAEHLRAEADREHLHPDAVPARHQVVPHLVHEHEHGDVEVVRDEEETQVLSDVLTTQVVDSTRTRTSGGFQESSYDAADGLIDGI